MSESIGDFWRRKIDEFRALLRKGEEAVCPVCNHKDSGKSGKEEPKWPESDASIGAKTIDGQLVWTKVAHPTKDLELSCGCKVDVCICDFEKD